MCFTKSSNDQKSFLNEIYKSDDSNKVEKAKKLFVETKADQAALNLVKKYSDLAIKSIDDLDVNQLKKQELIDLSQLLLKRQF
jgi:geranylgeranyl pyrophosphate synthase